MRDPCVRRQLPQQPGHQRQVVVLGQEHGVARALLRERVGERPVDRQVVTPDPTGARIPAREIRKAEEIVRADTRSGSRGPGSSPRTPPQGFHGRRATGRFDGQRAPGPRPAVAVGHRRGDPLASLSKSTPARAVTRPPEPRRATNRPPSMSKEIGPRFEATTRGDSSAAITIGRRTLARAGAPRHPLRSRHRHGLRARLGWGRRRGRGLGRRLRVTSRVRTDEGLDQPELLRGRQDTGPLDLGWPAAERDLRMRFGMDPAAFIGIVGRQHRCAPVGGTDATPAEPRCSLAAAGLARRQRTAGRKISAASMAYSPSWPPTHTDAPSNEAVPHRPRAQTSSRVRPRVQRLDGRRRSRSGYG